MIHTQQAQMQLDELKHGVIGLFKMRSKDAPYEMVVGVNEGNTIDTIRFTQFGVIQEGFNLPTHYGVLKLFPDNKSMSDMLDSPYEFDEFLKSFS